MFFSMKKHEIARAVQEVTDFLNSPIDGTTEKRCQLRCAVNCAIVLSYYPNHNPLVHSWRHMKTTKQKWLSRLF